MGFRPRCVISDSDEEDSRPNLPSYMRPTRASVAFCNHTPEKKKTPPPASSIRPVDPKNLPNYMRSTKAWDKQVEVVDSPVRMYVIKAVDPARLPSYMRSTKAWEKQIEPEKEVKKSVNIKPVDPSNLPSYMRPTKAWSKRVEKVEESRMESRMEERHEKSRISTTQSAQKSKQELPRYMRPTKAWERRVEQDQVPEEGEEDKQEGQAIQEKPTATQSQPPRVARTSQIPDRKPNYLTTTTTPKTTNKLPHYMLPTKASTAKTEAMEAHFRDRELAKKKKEEEAQQLLMKEEQWKKQCENVNRRISRK